jgi:hypothetical protein
VNEASDATMQQAPQPTQDRDWLLVEQGYDPRRERSVESRFTVSNGFLGVRGSRDQPGPFLGVLNAHTPMGLLAARHAQYCAPPQGVGRPKALERARSHKVFRRLLAFCAVPPYSHIHVNSV